MELRIANRDVHLDDDAVVGTGGEARVYRWRDLAVKVFHAPEDAWDEDERRDRRFRILQKERKIRAFPSGLPKPVLEPRTVATDPDGSFRGYAMAFVEGRDIRHLSNRSWCESYSNPDHVLSLFSQLRDTIINLHDRGVVCGDLNDTNLLFKGSDIWFIDVDSMQFGNYPCLVAHERFLDPRFFGEDLSQGVTLDEGSDWYAYAVMLFKSLLYVHPYGGVHPDHKTLLRRAEAHYSVLRGDVRYPRVALNWQVLPDAVIDWFGQIFDGGARMPPQDGLLEMRWRECDGCGAEHARKECPECSTRVPVSKPPVEIISDGIGVRELFRTDGVLLQTRLQDSLRWLYWKDGVFRREDGTEVLTGELDPDVRFGLLGADTIVGRGGKIVRMKASGSTETMSCDMLGGLPVFGANARRSLRCEGGWLRDDQGTRLGRTVRGRTWFDVGPSGYFGFYRAGEMTTHFMGQFDGGRMREVDLPPIQGRVLEAEATFSVEHVLFSMREERDGGEYVRRHLLSWDGKVLASCCGSADERPAFSNISGTALLNGKVITIADDGLVLLEARSGELVETRTYKQTRDLLSWGSRLLAKSDGTLYIADRHSIRHLSMNGS